MANIGSSIIGAALSAACLIGTLGGGFSKFTGTSLSEIFGGLFGGGSEMPGTENINGNIITTDFSHIG